MFKKFFITSFAIIVVFSQLVTATPVFAASDSCNHTDTETVEKQASTCTVEGYPEGVFCNDCNHYISGHTELSPLGHIDSNNDNYCDDCGIMFSFREAVKESCANDGYTGDVIVNGRVIIGENIPSTGHKDNNVDFVCDTCHSKITKNPIKITLHYYVTQEEYEANKDIYINKNYTVKVSDVVPGCMYITEKRTEIQNTEFKVPNAPKVADFKFVWASGNTAYKTFIFNEDKELYMSYSDENDKLEGQAGPNAYYIYHPEEKELEFVGTGELWSDFETKSEIPWYKHLMKAKKTVLHNKIKAKLWTIRKPN